MSCRRSASGVDGAIPGGAAGAGLLALCEVLVAREGGRNERCGRPSVPGPHDALVVLAERVRVGIAQLGEEIGQGLRIELKLPLEGAIGHAAPLAQQGNRPDPRPRQSPPPSPPSPRALDPVTALQGDPHGNVEKMHEEGEAWRSCRPRPGRHMSVGERIQSARVTRMAL